MATENSTGKILGTLLGLGALVALIIGVATPEGWLRKLMSGNSGPSGDPQNGNPQTTRYGGTENITINENISNGNGIENKCTLTDFQGRTITISSKDNPELFNRICMTNQPYFYRGSWYYPFNWWMPAYYGYQWVTVRRGRHHGGHHGGNGNGNGNGNGGNGDGNGGDGNGGNGAM